MPEGQAHSLLASPNPKDLASPNPRDLASNNPRDLASNSQGPTAPLGTSHATVGPWPQPQGFGQPQPGFPQQGFGQQPQAQQQQQQGFGQPAMNQFAAPNAGVDLW